MYKGLGVDISGSKAGLQDLAGQVGMTESPQRRRDTENSLISQPVLGPLRPVLRKSSIPVFQKGKEKTGFSCRNLLQIGRSNRGPVGEQRFFQDCFQPAY